MQPIKWRHASTFPATMANSYPPERAKAIYSDGYLTPYETPDKHRDKLAYRITEAALGLFLIESFIGGGPLGCTTSKEDAIAKCETHLAEWLLKCGLRQEIDATAILTQRLEKARATKKGFKTSLPNDYQRRSNAREIAECEIALEAIKVMRKAA